MGGKDATEVSNLPYCLRVHRNTAYHNNGIEVQRTLDVLVISMRGECSLRYRQKAILCWSHVLFNLISRIN